MITFIGILIIGIFIILTLVFFHYCDEYWWKKWSKNPKNFPFKYRGRTLWYSRSCAVSAFIFAKNKLGEWCVLANKRGKGAADFQGMWNGIAGYIDHNENAEQAVNREMKEECGVDIPIDRLRFYTLVSDPSENRQNITARYFAKIEDKNTEDNCLVPLITNKGEKDEVEVVAWIPISEVDNYEWAFNHNEIIKEVFGCKIREN